MEDKIYCCKITDFSESPELMAEILIARNTQFSTWTDEKEKISTHTVYCETEHDARQLVEDLKSSIENFRGMGISITGVEEMAIEKEDWSESWKKHFNIIKISDSLTVCPSWLEYTPAPKETVITLDPGMSFGTGQHPTTGFCLKMIDKLSPKIEKGSFLDAGCGSGILSIAARKLGFKKITAFDIDPDAIKVASENLEINGIQLEEVELLTIPIEKFVPKREYDLIAANILSGILKNNKDKLLEVLNPGGFLILAGILSSEYEDLKKSFTDAGLTEQENLTEKEWTSGLFH